VDYCNWEWTENSCQSSAHFLLAVKLCCSCSQSQTCRCAPLRCAIKRNVRQMTFLVSGSKSCAKQQSTPISQDKRTWFYTWQCTIQQWHNYVCVHLQCSKMTYSLPVIQYWYILRLQRFCCLIYWFHMLFFYSWCFWCIINYTAIYDVITDICLLTFLSETWSDLV